MKNEELNALYWFREAFECPSHDNVCRAAYALSHLEQSGGSTERVRRDMLHSFTDPGQWLRTMDLLFAMQLIVATETARGVVELACGGK